MKKSSQRRYRVNWRPYSDTATLEFIQENIPDAAIRTRVLNLLLWHGKYADASKFYYYLFQLSSMVCSAAIVVMNVAEFPHKGQAVTVASVLITLATGISMLMKFQENWLRYRKCCEQIKSECFLYLEGAGRYDGLDGGECDRLFSEYLELQALQINQEWLASEKRQEQEALERESASGEERKEKAD